MPVVEVKSSGKVTGYKFGQLGKLYTVAKYGKELAKYKAVMQAKAIQVAKRLKGGRT